MQLLRFVNDPRQRWIWHATLKIQVDGNEERGIPETTDDQLNIERKANIVFIKYSVIAKKERWELDSFSPDIDLKLETGDFQREDDFQVKIAGFKRIGLQYPPSA
jgi:hypothetical protein